MAEPNLVLDELEERFNAFQLVRKSDETAKDEALSEFGNAPRDDLVVFIVVALILGVLAAIALPVGLGIAGASNL